MHLKYRNVNDAFRDLVDRFNVPGWAKKTDSRNGPVLMIDEPLTVTYERPLERVLFNPVRDANPFFHLYESLWMLAGRDDVDAVAYYAKQMREFSDDGRRLNGAYGRRWRATQGVPQLTRNGYFRPGVDQLNVLVAHLKDQPNSRRAVLRMWNVEEDLLKIDSKQVPCGMCEGKGGISSPHTNSYHPCASCNDTKFREEPPSKDVCCNLEAMFSIREVESDGAIPPHPDWKIKERFLDMTVVNRSNDLLWGMLGANYVHFSFLQEYMACRLGVSVGRYHHVTNNCHVYTARKDWKPEELLADDTPDFYSDFNLSRIGGSLKTERWGEKLRTVPLVKDPARFDEEVGFVVQAFSGPDSLNEFPDLYGQLTEPFLRDVAYPMLICHWWHKAILRGEEDQGDREDALSNVAADDWRIAGQQWIARRMKK
jgi:thymidylate synthase